MAREHGTSTVVRRLARHQARRRQGIPTVSVLAGDDAHRAWCAWLAEDRRPGAEHGSTDQGGDAGDRLAAAWLACLGARRDLVADLLARLAREVPSAFASSTDPAELGRQLGRASPADRERVFRGLLAHGARPQSIDLCRALLAGDALAGDDPAGRDGRAAPQVLAELCAAVPEPALPGLLLIETTPWPAPVMDQIAARVAELATAAPALPLALAAQPATVRRFLATGAESRVKALVREGLIDCDPGDPDHGDPDRPRAQPATAPAPAPTPVLDVELAETRARLQSLGGSAELMDAFAHAAAAYQTARAHRADAAADHAPEDRARSAAERLLYRALEATPETAGLFTLNQRLDVYFGPAPMEVDLVCARLAVAVEVDGYYHFRDADAYRRDRRKDLLLQLERYLVVRCLADDVIADLGRVLDTVRRAVDAQRARQNQAGGARSDS